MPKALIDAKTAAALPKSVSSTNVIDIAVYFTLEAAAQVGTPNDQWLFAQQCVGLTNNILVNSGVSDVVFHLVDFGAVNRHEGNGIDADFLWLEGSSEVVDRRLLNGADLQVMIGNYPVGTVGRANLFQRIWFTGTSFGDSLAFGVIDRSLAQSQYDFPHEVGHLIGMDHSVENATVSLADESFPWSYGWRGPATSPYTLGFYDVMTYQGACGSFTLCYQIPYYSNSTIVLSGDPVQGRAIGVLDHAENYRTASGSAPYTAQFRTAPPPLFADGFE